MIHNGRPHEGEGWQNRTPVLILPVKGRILRTWGGNKNGKILRRPLWMAEIPFIGETFGPQRLLWAELCPNMARKFDKVVTMVRNRNLLVC